jgi:ribonuclease HII
MTIKEIKNLLAQQPSDEQLAELRADPRRGVQQLLASYQRRQQKLIAKKAAFQQRFKYEQKYWQQNKVVAGIDEVGRGPLAGPVVTAAVILTPDFDLLAVNDSKKLSPQKRLELYPQILAQAVSVAVGVKGPEVIDRVNIYQADRLAMKEAVLNLAVRPDQLLVDAMDIPVDLPQEKLIKGDSKSNSIAAASIVAKVFRDQLMDDYAQIYPEYDFPHNAGYGTARHIAALKKYGPTPIHRKTFAPVSDFY